MNSCRCAQCGREFQDEDALCVFCPICSKYEDEICDLIDELCHYRILALYLGASKEQMWNEEGRNLVGLDDKHYKGHIEGFEAS